jgi:serine/threonine protein kinase
MIESSVRQKLQINIEEGLILYDQLIGRVGNVLDDRYRLIELFDVGGQGILYKVEDILFPELVLLLKMPLREYHRSAYLTAEKINGSRAAILWEAHVLNVFTGTIFPEWYDVFEAVNLLHDTWWNSTVADVDPFLVMEFVQGETLDDAIGYVHKSQPKNWQAIERLACQVANEVLELCQMLAPGGYGYLYTDLRPQNIMIVNERDRRGKPGWQRRRPRDPEKIRILPSIRMDTQIRVVDAGSVVPCQPWKQQWPHHLAYVPPEYFALYEKGETLPWPNAGFVAYTLGKTLWQLLTAREPVPGQDPEFEGRVWRNYSADLTRGVNDLIKTRYESFDKIKAHNSIFHQSRTGSDY